MHGKINRYFLRYLNVTQPVTHIFIRSTESTQPSHTPSAWNPQPVDTQQPDHAYNNFPLPIPQTAEPNTLPPMPHHQQTGQHYAQTGHSTTQHVSKQSKPEPAKHHVEHLSPSHSNPSSSPAYAKWSLWTQCDQTCGGGLQYKARACLDYTRCDAPDMKTKECNVQPCDMGRNIISGKSWVYSVLGSVIVMQTLMNNLI